MATTREEALAELADMLNQNKSDFQGVYAFLQKHPEFVKEQCCPCPFLPALNLNVYPLAFLVSTKAPLSLVKHVYEMFPAATTPSQGGSRQEERTPLRQAILGSASFDVVSFLVETDKGAVFRTGWNHRELAISDLVRQKICGEHDIPDFEEIARLLVGIYPESMDTVDATAELNIFDYALIENTSTSSDSFLLWLAKLATEILGGITTCCIPQGEAPMVEDMRFTEEGSKAIVRNLKLVLPTFENSESQFHLEFLADEDLQDQSIHLSSIGKLFSEVPFSRQTTLTFRGWDMLGALCMETTSDWGSCCLEILSFDCCELSNDSFSSLLRGLQCLPCLKELKLRQLEEDFSEIKKTDGGTEAIVELLQGSRTLKYLSVSGMSLLDTEQMESALAKSTNSTAYFAYFAYFDEDEDSPNQTIAMLSSLNHHGRAKLCSPGASIALLAQSVASLMSDTRLPEDLQLSVLYGLLRVAPGLWAAAGQLQT